jgi:hypothetical protein
MKSNRWLRPGRFAALALALTFGACDSNSGSTPQGLLEPQFNVEEAGRKTPDKVREKRNHERSGELSVSRVIGRNGGSIDFRGHRLVVPAGAVEGPTVFQVAQVQEGIIEVDLQALQLKSNGTSSDRGRAGFAKQIVLELSFGDAEGVSTVDRLAIGWVREDGSIQLLPSVVDAGARVVRAQLDHFSKYAMVSN